MSVSNLSKRRGTILDEIMTYHREQLPKIKREVPLSSVRAFAKVSPPTNDFLAALKKEGVSLIAECKKASPSKGLIASQYNAVAIAEAYVMAKASAISVLTDARHFQGSLADLRDVKEAIGQFNVPVLRKDFLFDPYQIYESRAAGADAILLIVSVLSDAELNELLALTHQLGMNALVEVHTEEELKRALALDIKPRIIGVNNRNLQTFEVDFNNTARLVEMIPNDIVVVGESGIKTPKDVHEMRFIEVDAVLVGETLIRAKDEIETVTRKFVRAGLAGVS